MSLKANAGIPFTNTVQTDGSVVRRTRIVCYALQPGTRCDDLCIDCVDILKVPLYKHHSLQFIRVYQMELKKQLLEWYNTQLQEKNIFITTLEELSTGAVFLAVLHNFHPKVVAMNKVNHRPKNQYEVLQNYKHLLSCFSKIGWKKFDPERYSKQKEKDYLSLAQTLKKIFSSRSLKQSRLQSNLDLTLEQFQDEHEEKGKQTAKDKKQRYAINVNIAKLQKTKKQLLGKIGRVQQQLGVEVPGDDHEKIQNLRARVMAILRNGSPN